jgi:PAS domain S-box-containing protein
MNLNAINRQQHFDQRRYRILLLLASILYPVFGVIFYELHIPGIFSDLEGRIPVGIVAFLFLLGTFFFKSLQTRVESLVIVMTYLITAHYFSLVADHGLQYVYALGAFITAFACASVYESRLQMLLYLVFVVSAAAWIPEDAGGIPKTVFVAGLATALAFFYYAALTRFRVMDHMSENNRRMTEVFESMTDGFYFVDQNWNFISINSEAQRILGCVDRNLVGKNLWDTIPEFNQSQVRELFQQATQDRKKASLLFHIEPWNCDLDLRIYPSRLGLSVYFHDISEQTRTEAQLDRKRQLLQEAEQMAKLGHWDFDLQTRAATWSDEMFRLLEIEKSPEVIPSLELSAERIHPDDLQAVLKKLDRVTNHGESVAMTHRLLMKDGRTKWVTSRTSMVLNQVGVAVSLRGIVQDITEEQTTKAKAMNSAKMAALGEMSGGVAHEINNPLAIIHAKAQQLQIAAEKGRLTEAEVTIAAEKIMTTAMRIHRIIKSLRTFARDGENDAFRSESFRTIVDDTMELCRDRFKNENVKLRVRIPEDLVLECRSVQICQVLVNLLNNAFDATDGEHSRWVEISAQDLQTEILISVTDSGKGFLAENRDKVFQPFFTTKEIGKGTGLGLSVSKGIVESHGGNIQIDPSSDVTRINIRLPKKQNEEITIAQAS